MAYYDIPPNIIYKNDANLEEFLSIDVRRDI
ncbi:hypothetical protein C8E03_10493 [Lachnotalea glycerini]|uniref:Uncharacterized protein n=1 Tax=Lachnotalea glycerini TaxID=1763509 RepID=A0A318EP00_9FIRM|nr:hypothetical protein C8E03_10493 [Lachnotalea glycerini]